MMERDLFLLVFFGALIGFMGGAVLLQYPVSPKEPPISCPSCTLNESFMAYFLYPKRCVACEKNVPPSCDGCAGFYGEATLAAVSADLAVPLVFTVSDAVSDASVFAVSGGKAFLGSAKSKLAIAQTICAASGSARSCEVFRERVGSIRACFDKYSIPADAVVYHSARNCAHCEEMAPFVSELMGLSRADGKLYKVSFLSEDDASAKRILSECVGGVVELNYVPQVICPSNGKSRIGALGLSQLRDFADECADAADAFAAS